MRKILFMLALIVITTGCYAQQRKGEKSEQAIVEPSGNKPQVNWKVNRKYDDKGNLISYDSTYTWFYSGKSGKTHHINDSLSAVFQKQFYTELPNVFKEGLGAPYWADSMFHKWLNTPDYFIKNWRSHSLDMHKMMQRIDSLSDAFPGGNYPDLDIKKL